MTPEDIQSANNALPNIYTWEDGEVKHHPIVPQLAAHSIEAVSVINNWADGYDLDCFDLVITVDGFMHSVSIHHLKPEDVKTVYQAHFGKLEGLDKLRQLIITSPK